MHFATPSAGGGRLFVANGEQMTAFSIASPPPPSPTTTTISSSANPALAGETVTLTATVSPAPDEGSVAFSEGSTPIPGCAAVSVNVATGGQATCPTAYPATGAHRIVASYSGDAYYTASASAPLSELVTSGLASALPLSAPVISGATQSHSRWREGDALAQIARRHEHKPPVGTKFDFALNESASVRFAFTQPARGRRVGRRCLATRKARAQRHVARCTRTLTLAVMSFSGHAGTNTVQFKGRISRAKKLRPGRYTLVITASNAAGASAAARLRFTIVKV